MQVPQSAEALVRTASASAWLWTPSTGYASFATRVPTSGKRCATNRGRSPANNVLNLWFDPLVQQAVMQKHLDWLGLVEEEPDAGLGNGGLGRLADLGSYIEADQRLCALYADPEGWAR